MLLETGGFIFEGQVSAEGATYSRGNFISQGKSLKALKATSLLKFESIAGLKFHEERISQINEVDSDGDEKHDHF